MAVDPGDSAIPSAPALPELGPPADEDELARLRREREARDAEISAMLAEFDDKASDVVNLDSCEEASETSDEELATPDSEGCDLEVPENLDESVYDGSSDEGAAFQADVPKTEDKPRSPSPSLSQADTLVLGDHLDEEDLPAWFKNWQNAGVEQSSDSEPALSPHAWKKAKTCNWWYGDVEVLPDNAHYNQQRVAFEDEGVMVKGHVIVYKDWWGMPRGPQI